MIYLTDELLPSNLFHCDDLREPVRRLLERARQYQERGDLVEAERCAQAARTSSQETRGQIEPPGTRVEQAAALLHLTDIYRQMGRPGPALRFAHEAYDILRRQPGLAQRDSEALAAYSLGLIHHLLGNDVQALNWYQTASRLTALAQEYWSAQRESERLRLCIRLRQWLANLEDTLTDTAEAGGLHSIIIPTQVIGGSGSFFIAQVGGYILGQRLSIGNQLFQVEPYADDYVALLEGEEYQVFEVPAAACAQLGAQKGDYVLGRRMREVEPGAPYYVVDAASGPLFGRFEADPTDPAGFRLVSLDARVIGGLGDAELPCYCPVALLKPL